MFLMVRKASSSCSVSKSSSAIPGGDAKVIFGVEAGSVVVEAGMDVVEAGMDVVEAGMDGPAASS